MGKNIDDKKRDEGTQTEGFPTFDENKGNAEEVKKQAYARETAKVDEEKDEKADTKKLTEQEEKAKRRKIRLGAYRLDAHPRGGGRQYGNLGHHAPATQRQVYPGAGRL